jgi:hypothetical protein
MGLYLFIVFILLQTVFGQANGSNVLKVYDLKIPLEELTQGQVYFLKGYCFRKLATDDLNKCWASLDASQQAAYFSITHALTKVEGYGDALNLVEDVQEIHGQEKRFSSSRQFNLEVNWRLEAYETLKRGGINPRPGAGHPGERGLGEGRLGHTGIHFLFSEKNLKAGHVHVDYRPSTWIRVLEREIFRKESSHGHFDPYNADVRAVGPQTDEHHNAYNNLQLHEDWYGPFDLGTESASLPQFLQGESLQVFLHP